MPHPGIAGLLAEPSLGVIEATSPSESITQTYEVSCDINSSSKIPSFPFQRSIPLNVLSSLIKFNLVLAYSLESNFSAGTFTNSGSPT